MSRQSRGSVALLVAALATSVVAIGAEPALSADVQYTMTINKRLVVDYADSCAPAEASWGARGTGVAKAVLTWYGPDGSVEYRETARPGEIHMLGTGCPGRNDHGKSILRVTAYNSAGTALGHRDEWFYQKFNTTISNFNAAPEPVRAGRTITVSGRLLRLDHAPKVGYYSYGGKGIRIYFRTKGSTTWSSVGTATTGSDGRFKRNFTAKQDGYWRAHFPGTVWHDQQTSPTDYVDVT